MTNRNLNHMLDEGINDLLKILIRQGDVIIPIARKGIRLLELSPESKELFEKGKIIFYESVDFHSSELKNKRLVAFDEGIKTGETLKKAKKKLSRYSEKVFTAALLVNQDTKYLPDFFIGNLKVSNDLYALLSEELHYKILSSGKPMDVDHLIGKIEFSSSLIEEFKSVLNKEYDAIDIWGERTFDDLVMLTIDFNLPDTKTPFSFNIPSFRGFVKLFDDGPRKLRIYIKENKASIVPVIYPAMEINQEILKNRVKCPILELDNSLCKLLIGKSDEDDTKHSIICYNCIINELSTNLLSQFLVDLSGRIQFEFKGLDDKCVQVVSHEESLKILKILEERIKKSIEKRLPISSMNFGKASKCDFKGVSINENVSTIRGDYTPVEIIEDDIIKEIKLRPEIEISTAIEMNKKINEPLFKGVISSTDPQPEGLSYNQIKRMMKNQDGIRFSEGMDAALDVGYLKPITHFTGLRVYSDGKPFQAIVRLYTTGGEDVSKSLRCLLAFITP